MVHVSSAHIEKALLAHIRAEFSEYILTLKNSPRGSAYLDAFFTESEQLVFAKRLAVIVMLHQEAPWKDIMTALQVSKSTIAHLAQQKDMGVLDPILTECTRGKNGENFRLNIEAILREGMPAHGKGRWDTLNRLKGIDLGGKSSRK